MFLWFFLTAVSSPTEEQQLRTIWNEVSVGANGFLDKHELSVVCEHIGMEGMDEEVGVLKVAFYLILILKL